MLKTRVYPFNANEIDEFHRSLEMAMVVAMGIVVTNDTSIIKAIRLWLMEARLCLSYLFLTHTWPLQRS